MRGSCALKGEKNVLQLPAAIPIVNANNNAARWGQKWMPGDLRSSLVAYLVTACCSNPVEHFTGIPTNVLVCSTVEQSPIPSIHAVHTVHSQKTSCRPEGPVTVSGRGISLVSFDVLALREKKVRFLWAWGDSEGGAKMVASLGPPECTVCSSSQRETQRITSCHTSCKWHTTPVFLQVGRHQCS